MNESPGRHQIALAENPNVFIMPCTPCFATDTCIIQKFGDPIEGLLWERLTAAREWNGIREHRGYKPLPRLSFQISDHQGSRNMEMETFSMAFSTAIVLLLAILIFQAGRWLGMEH